MKRIGTQLQTDFPNTNGSLNFTATSLGDLIVGDVRSPLLMLLGAVGLVCSSPARMSRTCCWHVALHGMVNLPSAWRWAPAVDGCCASC